MNRILVVVGFCLSAASGLRAAEMPLVQSKKNTGADCPKPPLPEFSALPSIVYLPDPFLNGDARP